ncbi:MAG TPA: multidrug efflux SMR transporter [Thermomicrobiales bacterium]|nr:multidrug efflux SMR transporter [Thermomicrobiales bacterium]
MSGYVMMVCAILSEVAGTLALRASAGFTRPWFGVLVVLGYGSAFWCLSRALRTLQLGFVYAVWAGAGTALVAVLGVVLFRDRLDAAGIAGIGLIIAGVVVLNAFSGAAGH